MAVPVQRIVVWGYWSGNLGDDMFLATLKPMIASRARMILLTDKSFKQHYKKFGLTIVDRRSLVYRSLTRLCRMFGLAEPYFWICGRKSVFLMLGGSLFAENKSHEAEEQQLRNLKWAVQHAKSSYIIGSNFGPYNSEWFLSEYQSLLRKVTDTCFRDRYSYIVFAQNSNTRLAPDIVWAYSNYPVSRERARGVAISIINLENRSELKKYKNLYENTIKEICRFCQQKAIPVKLMSFCANEGDEAIIERITDDLESMNGIESIHYDGNIDFILNAINDCQLVIATRFHAMIIGWSLGKSVVPVIYSEKQTNTLKDIGFQGDVWNLKNGDSLDVSLIEQILETNGNKIETGTLKKQAQQQFKALDSFLNA